LISSYLFLFTSLSKSFFVVLFATYSVNVNFHDYSYYVDRMNPLFPCDHGAATHSCIIHYILDRGGPSRFCTPDFFIRKMRTGAARGLERYKIVEICGCGLTGTGS